MMTTGGQQAKSGTYWNMMTGERVDLSQAGTLPGGQDERYVKAPAFLAVAAGPLFGLVFAIFLPFIGIAMAVRLCVRKVAQGLSSAAASSMSFGWRPVEAYLAGKKREKTRRDSKKGPGPGAR